MSNTDENIYCSFTTSSIYLVTVWPGGPTVASLAWLVPWRGRWEGCGPWSWGLWASVWSIQGGRTSSMRMSGDSGRCSQRPGWRCHCISSAVLSQRPGPAHSHGGGRSIRHVLCEKCNTGDKITAFRWPTAMAPLRWAYLQLVPGAPGLGCRGPCASHRAAPAFASAEQLQSADRIPVPLWVCGLILS